MTNVVFASGSLNANAVATITPPNTEYATITWIQWSYNDKPVGGQLLIRDVTSNTTFMQSFISDVTYKESYHDFYNCQPAGMSFDLGHQIQVILSGTGALKALSVGIR